MAALIAATNMTPLHYGGAVKGHFPKLFENSTVNVFILLKCEKVIQSSIWGNLCSHYIK